MRRAAVGLVALALGNLTCAHHNRGLSPALSSAMHRLSIIGSDGNLLQRRSGDWAFRAAAWEARLDGSGASFAIDRPDRTASIAVRPLGGPVHFEAARDDAGALVYQGRDGDAAIVLRPGENGIKEDIVLVRPIGDRLIFSWTLDLAPGETAHLDGGGEVRISGSDGKRAFRIPAPIVKQASGTLVTDAARWGLHGRTLTLRTSGLGALDYPITIDPTVLVDGEAGLRAGNDEGGAGFGNDHLRRQRTAIGLGDWSPAAPIPGGRAHAAGAAWHDHLYVVGGSAGQNLLADVQVASLAADGTLGGWSAATSLPAPRTAHAVVAYDGFLYVIGGSDGKNPLADVQVAPILADGTLGAWSTAGSFTGARSALAALAYNGNLYVIGGSDGKNALADVQVAAIHGDGTLGTWATTGSLPSPRTRHAAVAWGDDLYILGGSDGKMLLGDVVRAPLSPSGSVGAFVASAPLPTPRADHQAAAHGGYLYVLGGCDDPSSCAKPIDGVLAGALGPAGRIAAWDAIATLPQPSANFVAVAYDDRLYAIGGGGMNGGVLDDTAVAPFTAGGSLAPWRSLPLTITPRLHHALVAYHGFLYSVGGCNSTLTFGACFPIAGHMLDEVAMAPILPDGTLGAWTQTTPLPSRRWGAGAVVANGYLIVTGGCKNSQCVSDNLAEVLSAPIDPTTGAVGAWQMLPQLPSPRWGHGAAAYNDHIYVTGGCTNGDSQPVCIAMQTDVLVALVKPNGTITPWTSSPNFFPSPRFGHTATAYNGRLYAIGGYDPMGYLADSLSAPIAFNGGIGPWTAGPPLPVGRAHHTTAAYNGNLYVVGGCNGNDLTIACNNFLVDSLVAPILSDGQPGKWSGAPLLAPGRARAGMVAENGFLYTFGGCADVGCMPWIPDLSVSEISSASGEIGPFTPTTSMPKTRWGHSALAVGGHLYVLAGLTNLNTSPDVIVAPVVDAGLGAWKLTTPFPVATWGQCTVATQGYIYSYGGDTAPVDHLLVDTGMRAAILPSGDLGTWEKVPSLPTVNVFHSCVAQGDTIYVTGGYDGVHTLPNVWYAKIDAQGMPGPWNDGTMMPVGRTSHSMTSYGGYLYVAGGSDDTGFLRDDILVAPLNADGSIGTWQPITSFPIARFSLTLTASDGYLYLMGGNTDTTGGNVPTNDILWAPILAHGTIGDWSPAGSYPSRVNESATVAGGKLFVVGGSEVGLNELADVQVTPLLPPAALGGYSRAIDIGYEARSLDTVTVNGTAGRLGQIRLRYRTAPESGQFGTTVDKGVVAPGAKIPLGDANARYLWVGLTLDDQASATLAPDATDERDVAGIDLDFTDRCAGVTCAVADECHLAGVCQPATGTCTNPAVDDGTECGNGLCEAGVCTARRGINGFACNLGGGSPTGPALILLMLLLLLPTVLSERGARSRRKGR